MRVPRQDAFALIKPDGVLSLMLPRQLPKVPNLTTQGTWWAQDRFKILDISSGYDVIFRTLAGSTRIIGNVPCFK